MNVYHGKNMYASGSEKTMHEKTLQRQGRRELEKYMFDAFMPVFCILTMKILYGVVPSVAGEGVWVRGAAHEEFVCKEVDELADWNHLDGSSYMFRHYIAIFKER